MKTEIYDQIKSGKFDQQHETTKFLERLLDCLKNCDDEKKQVFFRMAGDDFNHHNTCIRVALYELLLRTGDETLGKLLDELAKIGAPFEWQAMTLPDLYENMTAIFTPSGSEKQVDAKT